MEIKEVVHVQSGSTEVMALKEINGDMRFTCKIRDPRSMWLEEYKKRNLHTHIGSMCQEPSFYATFAEIAEALGFTYEVREVAEEQKSRYLIIVGESEYQILYEDAVGFSQFTPNKFLYDKRKVIFPEWNLVDIDINAKKNQMNPFLIVATIINDYAELANVVIRFQFHNAEMTFVCLDGNAKQIAALPETALALGLVCCSKIYVNPELMF